MNRHMLQFAGTPYGNIMYLINCTDAQWQEILYYQRNDVMIGGEAK